MKAWVLVPAPASAVSQASPIPRWARFLISNKMGMPHEMTLESWILA